MVDPTTDYPTFELDGVQRVMKFTTDSAFDLLDKHGIDLMDLASTAPPKGIAQLRWGIKILAIALSHTPAEFAITPEDLARKINFNVSSITKVSAAIGAAMGKAATQDESTPIAPAVNTPVVQ